MHGYKLKSQAERERVGQWTDISVGSIYGALKRLVTEGLIEIVRTERDGRRPDRQVFAITDAGRAALVSLRVEGSREVVVRADPFDLAFTRPDLTRLDEQETILRERLEKLHQLLDERREFAARVAEHLSIAEAHVLRHREFVIQAEIDWHELVLSELPAIIADQRARTASFPRKPAQENSSVRTTPAD